MTAQKRLQKAKEIAEQKASREPRAARKKRKENLYWKNWHAWKKQKQTENEQWQSTDPEQGSPNPEGPEPPIGLEFVGQIWGDYSKQDDPAQPGALFKGQFGNKTENQVVPTQVFSGKQDPEFAQSGSPECALSPGEQVKGSNGGRSGEQALAMRIVREDYAAGNFSELFDEDVPEEHKVIQQKAFFGAGVMEFTQVSEARLRVLSLDCYLRPAAEVPQAHGGANWTHSDAIDFERLRVDLRVLNDPGCEILVLADDRVCGCRELLHDAEEIVLCSSSEPGCFQDCVLSRVTLQDYSARIWPTYRDRAKEFLRMSAELSLTKKLRILDEDAFRQEVLASDFADTFFGQLLDAKNVPKATQADLQRWGARVDVSPPERNQRTFQQLRKEVLYPIEAEAKRFAVKVLRLLKPEPSKALQEILNYRLSIRAMSKEERAKWSSVLCTRELGPSGEILSVEMLRWAWRSLKDLPPMDADDLPRADLVLALSPPCGEELIPFASLLESSAKGLEPICLAVDTVIDFGRLHFLRQRMWDASPEVTLDLARRLLEHKHWLLKALGTRFAGQLLDADAPRYQVCFRDLTQHGGVPFAQTLAQALLCLSAPLTEESHVEDTESSSAVAFSSGAWRSVQIRCRRGGEGGGEVLVAVDRKEQWLPSYWVRASTPGHDYWQRLREWWLVDPFALRKLLDRAPDHCSKCLEASLAQPLAERLSAALRSGALGLAAELAASLLRLARYGASSANSDATSSSASAARAGTLMKDLQLLVASLSDLGIEQGLAEAMALLALMARSKNVAATLERAVEDIGESNAPAFAAPPAFAPASASASEFRLREATEDPGRRVLELMQLKEQLKLSDQRQAQLQEDSRRKEAEVQRCRDAMALLLEEKKALAQRVADLELTRAAAVSAASAPAPALPMGAEADVEAEEDDWVLKADVESLSEADAQSFVARLAKRRDSVTALRSSLCGALRQLGENLYTSSVHFVDELLQNADDCSYLQEPSFRLTVTADQAHFFYNERGFRPKDVLSLCSLAVSTKSGDEFLGHKGVGFKSVFACSNTPSICSGKFRFKFEVPGPDELAYITPRWLEPCAFATHEGDGTHILLPFRPELVGDAEFLQKLEAAFDPLVLLGLSRLRHLAFEGDALKLSAHLTKGPEESFLEVATFSCCLRTANSKRLFRVFASADGRLRLAFPELPGPELPVCAGLPCAHVGH
ncbi:unnamed protein product, partial [Effrenium voratum]